MELVFVYGTLRQGERYHTLMGDSRLLYALAQVKGTLQDTGLGYPVLLEREGRVAGELYEVTEEILQKLDELEGYVGPGQAGNEYERVLMEVVTDRGTVMAWVYVYRLSQQYLSIPEGDWKLYRLKQEEELYYFAYGSCMDLERIELAGAGKWFDNVAGCAVLEGFSVEFTLQAADGGRADLVEGEGRTEGKLYRIVPECLYSYLFKREGVEDGVYRPAVLFVQCEDGVHREAVTFVVVNKESALAPPEHYMREILRGAEPVVSPEYYAALEKRFVEVFGYTQHVSGPKRSF